MPCPAVDVAVEVENTCRLSKRTGHGERDHLVRLRHGVVVEDQVSAGLRERAHIEIGCACIAFDVYITAADGQGAVDLHGRRPGVAREVRVPTADLEASAHSQSGGMGSG